ncbi:MAG: CDP-alcohol phosphatidyltransferase [Prevotellaceae bacterium]|jgi:phosphatidylglycerophosphate synthase|nr:CDP-alcohol phosphatidyltransferase [Prevotellaceae bacterium]
MNTDLKTVLAKIAKDRERTNILKKHEQKALAILVRRIPSWINSDMLTVIGMAGSLLIMVSFVIAASLSRYYLLLGIAGFAINWFGDSLDGRLAYFRNKPRRWYGFSLDFCADWWSIICIGAGFIIYVGIQWELWGFAFVVLYGWAMMMALLRYKITDIYTIDSGIIGPTEVRIVISLILALEIFVPGSIHYSTVVACALLFIFNLIDFLNLLKIADRRDRNDRLRKEQQVDITNA